MKTFLKILLIALVIYAVIKFSPVIFIGAVIGCVIATVFAALGASLLVTTLGVVLGIVMALAPLWLPIFAIIGILSLFKKEKAVTPPLISAGS